MEFTHLSLSAQDAGAQSPLPMNINWNLQKSPVVDLHIKHPLPSDWEQCLDLQTGKMYYVNKKTGRKRWTGPEEQKVDLELNISAGGHKDMMWEESSSSSSSSSSSMGMVALPCSNCHLLVILSRSSPSCPNCKYVHSLAPSSSSSPSYASSIGPSNWTL